MGYTHYWYLNEKANNVSAFVKATAEMCQIIQDQQEILGGFDGSGKPDLKPDKIIFNGLGDEDSYETFFSNHAAIIRHLQIKRKTSRSARQHVNHTTLWWSHVWLSLQKTSAPVSRLVQTASALTG